MERKIQRQGPGEDEFEPDLAPEEGPGSYKPLDGPENVNPMDPKEVSDAYLCRILGQWDTLLLNFASISFTNFI